MDKCYVMAKATLTCKKCVLDATTPGISINAETGLCQFCEHYTPLSKEKKEEYRARMDTLLKSPPHRGKYDVIFALSGGVDSSYTLYRLKKEYPHLRILAVQFDNGFISETALENAQKFCDLTKSTYMHLTLDQIILQDTFSKAARSTGAYPGTAKYRASDICNTCISIIKQKIIELAITTKSPFIVFAFSPGQTDAPFVTLTKPFLVWMRKLFDGNLKAMGVTERDAYLIDAHLIQPGSPGPEVTIIHPFLIWEYNKPEFKKECIRLGWIDPDLKDHNSSNCLLNAFAIQNHLEKYHIHSYAYDLAALVRQGNMERDDAMKKLKVDASDASIEEVQRKLNL
jgi:tRNA(Ile)-lysidine synthase TilS/MesJ